MRESELYPRLSIPVLRTVFLATLVAGAALAPVWASAQEAAPASQPASSSQAAEPAGKEAAKSETVDENKFRHTPLVEASAKALHLPVETMARTYEFINFAIIALAIGIPLFRILPRLIKARGAKIRDDIESARKVTEDANARLAAVEEKLASLGAEIEQFRAEVEQESLQDQARIKAAMEEESVRIVSSAGQEIGAASAQAQRSLRRFAAELAIEQAARQLVVTPEADRALIAEFASAVGAPNPNGATHGGQN